MKQSDIQTIPISLCCSQTKSQVAYISIWNWLCLMEGYCPSPLPSPLSPLPSHRFPRHFPLDPALAPSLPQLSSFYSLTCLSIFRLYYLCGYWMCSDKGFTAVGDVDGVCSSPRTLPLRYISSNSISASSLSYNLLYRPFLTYQDQAPNIDMIFLLTWNILVRNGG